MGTGRDWVMGPQPRIPGVREADSILPRASQGSAPPPVPQLQTPGFWGDVRGSFCRLEPRIPLAQARPGLSTEALQGGGDHPPVTTLLLGQCDTAQDVTDAVGAAKMKETVWS